MHCEALHLRTKKKARECAGQMSGPPRVLHQSLTVQHATRTGNGEEEMRSVVRGSGRARLCRGGWRPCARPAGCRHRVSTNNPEPYHLCLATSIVQRTGLEAAVQHSGMRHIGRSLSALR